MAKELIQPENVYKATTYSHAVKKNNIVFISGQVSKDVHGKLVGSGDISAQAEQVFKNLQEVTEASGATLRDIVKLTIFTTNVAFYRPGITSVRDRYFKEEPPATTFVVVTSLSDPYLLLEVEAVAILDK
jgi:reactive intermediate/imine deaminase